MYASHVWELAEDKDANLEILELPPMRIIDFSVDFVLRVVPISRASYRMSIPTSM